MKTCCTCKELKPFIEFHKNKSLKDGFQKRCKACVKKSASAHYKENKDRYRQNYRTWRSSNLEKARELERNNFQNPSRKHKHRINQAFRRATKLKATIPGYESELRQIYDNCPIGFHVDHIVPLRGKSVCGLHVPWNLQYLTPQENMKKGNKVILTIEDSKE